MRKKQRLPLRKTAGRSLSKWAYPPVPHAEILGAVKDKLAKEGINVEIIEFTDTYSRTWH